MHVSENKRTNSSQTTKNCNDRNSFFQSKLTVNEPGDEYEQEADRVADHIMRMPINDQPFFKPMSPAISTLQKKCKDCEDEEKLQRKEKTIQRQPANPPSADLTISGDWEDQYHKTPNANNYQLNDVPLSFKSNRNKTNYADANLDLIGRGINNPDEYDKDYNNLWQSNLDFTRGQRLGTMYKNLRQKTLLSYVLPEPSKGMSDDVFLTNKMSLAALDADMSAAHPAFNEGSGIIIPLKTFAKHFDENNLFKKDDSQHNDANKGPDRNASVEKYVSRLHASGKKLDKSTKNFFEPRIGYDLSDVKVHTDSEAAKSAESVNALAYTFGDHIVFNQNQFNPESDKGKKLLAHELTHVMQQRPPNIIFPKQTYFNTEGITDARTVNGVKSVEKIIVATLSDPASILYPYIKDKLGSLPAILDKMRITSAAEFGHSYKSLKHIVDTHHDEDVANSLQGFTNAQTKEIYLYLRSNYCHAFHEAIHTLSYPMAIESNFGLDIMEGLTQYFTDIIFTEQTGGPCTTHNYKAQLVCANALVSDFTRDVAAQIFFQGKFGLLGSLANKLKFKNSTALTAHYKNNCQASS